MTTRSVVVAHLVVSGTYLDVLNLALLCSNFDKKAFDTQEVSDCFLSETVLLWWILLCSFDFCEI